MTLGNIQQATAVLAWDGDADCDLVLGLAANNALHETIYFDVPRSSTGAVQLQKDKRNGHGLSKADESALIQLGMIPPHINEVPVGAIVQNNLRFGNVSNARLIVQNLDNGAYLGDIDLDDQFRNFPAGKVGEFKRVVGGGWQFFVELRPYGDIDVLAANLAV